MCAHLIYTLYLDINFPLEYVIHDNYRGNAIIAAMIGDSLCNFSKERDVAWGSKVCARDVSRDTPIMHAIMFPASSVLTFVGVSVVVVLLKCCKFDNGDATECDAII